MTITLASDKKHYARGETVTLVMTVTNTTDQEKTFQHSTSGYIGFRVQNDEVEIWDSRYMAGALQARSSETYAPGQARQFKAAWNQGICSQTSEGDTGALPAGTYTSFGIWSTDDADRGNWSSDLISFTLDAG